MAGFSDYDEYDGLGLAALVTERKVKPRELVEAAITRIERVNPQINAVVHKAYERALRAADGELPEGPFRGVPFLLKDLAQAWEGAPLTAGSRARWSHVPSASSELVNRYGAAGLVILGKTNTPEYGLLPVTEPELHGPTRNPWNLDRTPGGSSGGAAAAVAAGFVPMAHGADGGGSIRIPASACGLFGLKPTRGRTPVGPDHGEAWFGLSVNHALTRSVRDSAALLDATHGPDRGAPYAAPEPARPFLEEVGAPPGSLRVGFTTSPLMGRTMERPCVEGVRSTAKLLDELGHRVQEVDVPIEAEWTDAFVLMAVTGTAFEVEESARLAGSEPERARHEQLTWVTHLVGQRVTASELAYALHVRHQAGRAMAALFEDLDVLVTSTLGRPPWPLGDLDPSAVERKALGLVERVPSRTLVRALLKRMSSNVMDPIPNTPIFNMSGQPAASLPLHWTDDGLPVGVQIATRFGDEATLFRLAAQLEEARPWSGRRP